MAIPPKDQEAILAAHATGLGRNQIANQMGLSTATVSRVVAAAGKSFNRQTMIEAGKARRADLAAKRAQLESDLLDDAVKLRRQLWEPMVYRQTGLFSQGLDKRTEWLEDHRDRPLPSDQAKIVQATATALTSAQKIADASADQGTDTAKAMLTGLMEGLGDAYRKITTQEE